MNKLLVISKPPEHLTEKIGYPSVPDPAPTMKVQPNQQKTIVTVDPKTMKITRVEKAAGSESAGAVDYKEGDQIDDGEVYIRRMLGPCVTYVCMNRLPKCDVLKFFVFASQHFHDHISVEHGEKNSHTQFT